MTDSKTVTRNWVKSPDNKLQQLLNLLTYYGFEVDCKNAEDLIRKWLDQYDANWIRLALIEALYQGRYKAVSIEHILTCWQRRGQPLFHFNIEFEILICNSFAPPEPDPDNPPENPGINRNFDAPEILPLPILNIEDVEELEVQIQELISEDITLDSKDFILEELTQTPLVEEKNISQFIPNSQHTHTDFYTKLKAVAQGNLEEESSQLS
jgi:hypothetical protein